MRAWVARAAAAAGAAGAAEAAAAAEVGGDEARAHTHLHAERLGEPLRRRDLRQEVDEDRHELVREELFARHAWCGARVSARGADGEQCERRAASGGRAAPDERRAAHSRKERAATEKSLLAREKRAHERASGARVGGRRGGAADGAPSIWQRL